MRLATYLTAGALVLGACGSNQEIDEQIQTVVGQTKSLRDAVTICVERRTANAVNSSASQLGWQKNQDGLVKQEIVFKATPGQVCDLRYPQYLYEASIKAAVARMRARRPKGAQIIRTINNPGHVVHTLQEDPPNVLTFLKDGPDDRAQLLR